MNAMLVNASLAKQIGHYLPASAVSFLGGTVLLAVIIGRARPTPWQHGGRPPALRPD